jgi:hypothetical protein
MTHGVGATRSSCSNESSKMQEVCHAAARTEPVLTSFEPPRPLGLVFARRNRQARTACLKYGVA